MNAAILTLVVALVVKTDCFVLEKRNDAVKEEAGDSVSVQKVQNPIHSNPENETNSITWSEILANVLINSIRIIRNPSNADEVQEYVLENNSTQSNLVTKFCSQVLYVYKHYIYDKFFHHDNVDDKFGSTANNNDNGVHVELREMELSSQEATNDFEVITLNPNVEIISPQYHGKICSDCEEERIEKKENDRDCPEGLARDAAGNCGDPKSLNFITSVPYQCPTGYKRDWFGYCKPIF